MSSLTDKMQTTLFETQWQVRLRFGKMQSTIVTHMKLFWLFNFSDLKTIVIPSTVFGLTNAAAAEQFGFERAPSGLTILRRILPTLFWVWLNLLPFAINNQRTPAAITEDSINKPWRPLPSRRVTPAQAKAWMLFFYTYAVCYSAFTGSALTQSASLVVLGTWYNNCDGADASPIVRNAINALGYICFTSGALEIAVGSKVALLSCGALIKWLGIIAGIVFTTVHTMDMYDQEGDAARGRRTLPLVIGDNAARWIICVFMYIWGVACPMFWHAPPLACAVSMMLAGTVGFRTLYWRSVADDKRTFIVWNVWMASVYTLPLTGHLQLLGN
jgi:4-hydroxybenzoate polyprenyltransferase